MEMAQWRRNLTSEHTRAALQIVTSRGGVMQRENNSQLLLPRTVVLVLSSMVLLDVFRGAIKALKASPRAERAPEASGNVVSLRIALLS